MPEHPTHDTVPVRLAAELCSVSGTTIRFWASQGYIDTVKEPGRPLQVTVESLNRVLGTTLLDEDVIQAARYVHMDKSFARIEAPGPPRFTYSHRGKPPVYEYQPARFHPDHKL